MKKKKFITVAIIVLTVMAIGATGVACGPIESERKIENETPVISSDFDFDYLSQAKGVTISSKKDSALESNEAAAEDIAVTGAENIDVKAAEKTAVKAEDNEGLRGDAHFEMKAAAEIDVEVAEDIEMKGDADLEVEFAEEVEGNDEIEAIEIEKNDLDSWQFFDLDGEVTLTIPEGVKSIGNVEVRGEKLTKLVIEGEVERVVNFQFYDTFELKELTLPSSLKSINNFEFHSCNGLEEIVLSENLEHIGNFQFYSCDIEKVDVALSTYSIGNFEFHSCSDLTGFAVSGEVEKIDNLQLYDAQNADKLIITGNVKEITNFQIYNSSFIREAFVYMNLGYVNSLEFHNCANLELLVVTDLSKTARLVFADCPKMGSVCLKEKTKIDEKIYAYLSEGRENEVDVYLYSEEETRKEGFWYWKDGKVVTVGDKYTQVSPADFFVRWGVGGQSSYDGKTGKLVKTTDVIERSPDDYVTTLFFSKEDEAFIWQLLEKLRLEDYPDEYDPYMSENGETVGSSPSVNLVLTVGNKTVYCSGIAIGGVPSTEKGKNFMETINLIIDMITSSDEWKALPDYEVLYL